jgi:hypothetical protein
VRMSSAELYGLIDIALRRWKDSVGHMQPVHTTAEGELLCPMCRARRMQVPLREQDGSRVWRCRQAHAFQETTLPE